jgi:hypothetical protein
MGHHIQRFYRIMRKIHTLHNVNVFGCMISHFFVEIVTSFYKSFLDALRVYMFVRVFVFACVCARARMCVCVFV